MALDCSPDPSNSSELLSRHASWPRYMTGESNMWPLEYKQGFSKFEQCHLVFDPMVTNIQTWPRNHQNKLSDQFPGYSDQNSSH
jgi:hypothetical protein